MKKKMIRYLVFVFIIAWIIQAVVAVLSGKGNAAAGRALLSVSMFVPMLSVLLSGNSLKEMGWKPQIRKNIRQYIIAWFAPAALTAIGAALYFLVFPGHFDLGGQAMAASAGEEALEQLAAQGITYPMYIMIAIIEALTFAPFVNMLFALGEEVGWRGYLYPQLKAEFGRNKGRVLGGIIWGVWHWPLIWLIGYEYGTDYIGFPVVGMLLFLIITVAWGTLHDWLYEKSGSIWVPALLHGALNAAAGIPLMVCVTDIGSARLLGPAPVGILAAVPFILIAGAVMRRQKDRD